MEDQEIIDLYLRRSENAISQTDIKYGKHCRRLSMNILSCPEDAEECVNDTYLTAWNTIPPQHPVSLCAFISSITRNLALKKYAYISAGKRNPEVTVSFSELEDCVSGKDTVEEAAENGRIGRAVSDFLRTLSHESRNVFLRRYWYFDSIAAIAQRFGISESKAASMLWRTRRKLRAYLQREGIDL